MWRRFVFWWGNVRRQWRYYGSPRVSYVRGVPRRVLAGGRLPPRLVDRYLLRTEVIVRALRLHPVAIIVPAMWILAGLVLAGIVTKAALPGHAGFVGLVWTVFAVLEARPAWQIVTWWRRYFVITENRLMLITSVLNTDVGMMPLSKVTDMRYFQSTFGRWLGYAAFIVESAGQDQALSNIRYVPFPAEMYQEILTLLFRRTPRRRTAWAARAAGAAGAAWLSHRAYRAGAVC